MIAEIHDKLSNPRRVQCSRVVIRDVFDNPIVIVLEHAPGQYFYKCAGEPGFDRTLDALGIKETVVSEVLDPAQVQSPPGQLLVPGNL
jgi:hypothetical protein